MNTHRRAAAGSALILFLAAACLGSPDWPSFRGPRGDGTVDAAELPLRWSESKNVVWKAAIHDRGWSTPVVWGDQVWLTTATEDGREMFAICVDRATGKVLQDLKLFHNEAPEPLGNDVNCYASPSPAIEKDRVYIHFGSYGTVCLDSRTSAKVWERRDLPCRHFRGPGSSPILWRDFLILTMDGFDVQYLCALDRKTGATVWKTDRSYPWGDLDGDLRKAYTTPLVAAHNGVEQLLSSSAKASYSYDPLTGKELWRIRYDGYSNAAMPVAGLGLAFINTGFGKADLWAVSMQSQGEVPVSGTEWKCNQAVPLKPSPVLAGELIFLSSDSGVASCIEARTGKQVWQTRVGGRFTASPIHGAGRVYLFSEEGKTIVLRAGRSYEVLATNELESGFMASPAAAGKSLFLRTRKCLYRIEE